MESWFSNIYFACALRDFQKTLNIAILWVLPLNTVVQICCVSEFSKSLWRTVVYEEERSWPELKRCNELYQFKPTYHWEKDQHYTENKKKHFTQTCMLIRQLRIQTHHLHNTDTMLYRLSYEASLEAGQLRVQVIPVVKISFKHGLINKKDY